MIELRQAPAALPRGRRIYVIGDIHGSIAKLRDLHGQIGADLKARPVASALLLHLGDYVDKGGDSRAVYDVSLLPEAKVKLDVPSAAAGYVRHIEAEKVGLVSMHLGGGRATKDSAIDLSVGVLLNKKVGDRVEAGESLGTIHAASADRAREAAELLRGCYELSDGRVERAPFIKAIIR